MRAHKRGHISYGQEGEDRVLASILFKLHGGFLPVTGFYIDIGAHHPFLYSNTYAFYKLGWSGLNIDAAPGAMQRFNDHRPRDVNVEIGIGKVRSTVSFHVFNEPALSTFDENLAVSRAIAPRRVVEVIPVEIVPAAEVFARYLKPGQRVDFLTVDVEGFDMDVLQSNDWSVFRPMVVAVEIYNRTIAEAINDEVAVFLASKDYIFYSKTVNTAFFVESAAYNRLASASGQ